jgi:hypothetical protein
MLITKGSIIKLVGPFFMSIYIRMPTINFSVTQSIETLAVNLSASEALVMNINNPLTGASYFGLETIPDNNGVYTSTAPKNTSGSFTLGTGVLGVVRDDYKMSAVVSPGNNVLTFSPAVAVIGSTLRTRGIGAPPPDTGYDADAQAFFARVATAGGTLTTIEMNATNQLVLDMKSTGVWTSMKAVYPMIGASAAACAQNLKSSSFTGTFTSGWTFTSSGIISNGTSAYFDTKCRVVPDLTNFNLSWAYTGVAASWNGSFDGSTVVGFNSKNQIGLQNLANVTGTIPSSFRMMSGTVNSSASNDAILYFDGIQQSTYQANTMTSDISFILGALNTGTFPTVTPTLFNVVNISTLCLGNKLNGTEMANLYNSINAFNTTLSR